MAPNLRILDLHKPRCSSDALATIGNCHALESLSIHGYRTSCVTNIDVGIVAIAAGCSKLRCIKLTQLPNLTGECLAAIATHCGQLQELHSSDNQALTDSSLVAFAGKLSNTTTSTSSLRYLLLQYIPLVTGSGIGEVAKACPLLHTLDLSNMNGLAVDNLHMVIPHLNNVVSLNLYGVSVDDVALELIAEHMPRLMELNIANYDNTQDVMQSTYTSIGLHRIADQCEKLKVLNLGEKIASLSKVEVQRWRFLRPGLTITPLL